MADTVFVRKGDEDILTVAASVGVGELFQLSDGRAARYRGTAAASSGDQVYFDSDGKHTCTKTSGFVALAGGRAYWDHSANAITYKKVNDRDFYVGRFAEDAASTEVICVVDLNVDPPYDLDLARDPFATTIVGTQALGGLGLLRRGGCHNIVISATNEAQKVDMLGKDGFARTANAIIEGCFNVISDGAGTVVDVSMGIANGTHATDADSIAESLFVHLNANDVNIYLESDDGTTEVAATDTTIDYTEGVGIANRVEFWMDMRNEADIQCYINGVLALTASVFKLDAATGPLRLLVHVEKTASTDAYELDIEWLRARFMEQ